MGTEIEKRTALAGEGGRASLERERFGGSEPARHRAGSGAESGSCQRPGAAPTRGQVEYEATKSTAPGAGSPSPSTSRALGEDLGVRRGTEVGLATESEAWTTGSRRDTTKGTMSKVVNPSLAFTSNELGIGSAGVV